MRTPHASRIAAVVSAASLVVVALASPGTTRAAATPTFSVSPQAYVGGQLITFSGTVGASGVRVKLQGSQRPGAPWQTITRTRSGPGGDYTFSMGGPSMFGIMRRVVANGEASSPIRLYPKSQDLVVAPVGAPVAGRPFELEVSTRPSPDLPRTDPFFVGGRPDLPAPAFPGRELTLQRRVGSSWADVPGGTTRTDPKGLGSFTVQVDEPGTIVYRVVQEDYTEQVTDSSGNVLGRHDIGWFPSFPTPVHVAASEATATTYPAPGATRVTSPAATSSRSAPLSAAETEVAGGGPRNGFTATTASSTHKWGQALWDFGYAEGQSLTSEPSRGSDLRGWWLDESNGTGRAATHNGGVVLDSQRYSPEPKETGDRGDIGDTWLTLKGQPARYGRWETRIRLRPYESARPDYRGRVELIPANPNKYRCGGRNIVVADLAAHSRKMRFGVKASHANRKWTRTRRIGDIENHPVAVAVEVTRKHITWFLNGRPVGTVRNRKAVSDVPLTMRLVLDGKGSREMNRTKAHFDWMRGFSLQRGAVVRRGGPLRSTRFRGGC